VFECQRDGVRAPWWFLVSVPATLVKRRANEVSVIGGKGKSQGEGIGGEIVEGGAGAGRSLGRERERKSGMLKKEEAPV